MFLHITGYYWQPYKSGLLLGHAGVFLMASLTEGLFKISLDF